MHRNFASLVHVHAGRIQDARSDENCASFVPHSFNVEAVEPPQILCLLFKIEQARMHCGLMSQMSQVV
jgi:hypothetical protein